MNFVTGSIASWPMSFVYKSRQEHSTSVPFEQRA
jgi:hypothetical protein